jgi:hypothetical protein
MSDDQIKFNLEALYIDEFFEDIFNDIMKTMSTQPFIAEVHNGSHRVINGLTIDGKDKDAFLDAWASEWRKWADEQFNPEK